MVDNNSRVQQTATPGSSGSKTNISGHYLATVGAIMKRMRAAFQLVPKQTAEFDFDLRAWAEILADEIPEAELNAVYHRAMKDHTSLYALSATEMLLAYRAMLVETAVSTRKRVCSHCDAHAAQPKVYPACPFHPDVKVFTEFGPALEPQSISPDGVLSMED